MPSCLYTKRHIDGMRTEYNIPNVTSFNFDVPGGKVTIKFTTAQGTEKTIVEMLATTFNFSFRQ